MSEAPDAPNIAAIIAEIVRLDEVAYAAVRAERAAALGISVTALDTARKEARKAIRDREAAERREKAAAEKLAAKEARDELLAEKRAASEKPELSAEQKRAEIKRLAALDDGPYAIERKAAARAIGITGRVLDNLVAAEKDRQAGEAAARDPIAFPAAVAKLAAIDRRAYPAALAEEAAKLGIDPAALHRAVQSCRRETDAKAIDADIAALISEFNKLYTVVLEGGKAIIYKAGHDATLARDCIVPMAFDDLKRLYLNRQITVRLDKSGNPIQEPVAEVWLHHEDRKQYIGGVVFDPSGRPQPKDVLNLWTGFAVKPMAGKWAYLKDHIRNNVCGGNEEYFEWFMNWMARLIQFPGEPAEVAIVMRSSEQGTGKGTVARALLHLIGGRHAMPVSNSKHLVGNFNWHLREIIFLFADEAFFAGDRAHIGVLNSLITEPVVTIEGKGRDIQTFPNLLHIMMASNEDWVVPASADARRYFVLDVLPTVLGNREYFDNLNEEMRNGGYEAMLDELLHRDIAGFDYRTAPQTAALGEQKKLSMGTTDAWWGDVLHRGYLLESKCGLQKTFNEWFETATTDLLFKSYKQFAQERRERHPIGREALGRKIRDYGGHPKRLGQDGIVGEEITDVPSDFGGSARKGVLVWKDRPHAYKLGTLQAARTAFAAATKVAITWDDEENEPEGVSAAAE